MSDFKTNVMNLPYRCPKCESRHFPTLYQLRSHLESEHQFVNRKRERVNILDYDMRKLKPPPGPFLDPSVQQFLDENKRLEKELEDLKQAEKVNRVMRRKHRPIDNSDNHSVTSNLSRNFQITDDSDPSVIDDFKLSDARFSVGPLKDQYLTAAVDSLSHEVEQSRDKQWRAADALYQSKDVLGDIEKASEIRNKDQNQILTVLDKTLKHRSQELEKAYKDIGQLHVERKVLLGQMENMVNHRRPSDIVDDTSSLPDSSPNPDLSRRDSQNSVAESLPKPILKHLSGHGNSVSDRNSVYEEPVRLSDSFSIKSTVANQNEVMNQTPLTTYLIARPVHQTIESNPTIAASSSLHHSAPSTSSRNVPIGVYSPSVPTQNVASDHMAPVNDSTHNIQIVNTGQQQLHDNMLLNHDGSQFQKPMLLIPRDSLRYNSTRQMSPNLFNTLPQDHFHQPLSYNPGIQNGLPSEYSQRHFMTQNSINYTQAISLPQNFNQAANPVVNNQSNVIPYGDQRFYQPPYTNHVPENTILQTVPNNAVNASGYNPTQPHTLSQLTDPRIHHPHYSQPNGILKYPSEQPLAPINQPIRQYDNSALIDSRPSEALRYPSEQPLAPVNQPIRQYDNSAPIESRPSDALRYPSEQPLAPVNQPISQYDNSAPIEGRPSEALRYPSEQPLSYKNQPIRQYDNSAPIEGRSSEALRYPSEQPLSSVNQPIRQYDNSAPIDSRSSEALRYPSEQPLAPVNQPISQYDNSAPIDSRRLETMRYAYGSQPYNQQPLASVSQPDAQYDKTDQIQFRQPTVHHEIPQNNREPIPVTPKPRDNSPEPQTPPKRRQSKNNQSQEPLVGLYKLKIASQEEEIHKITSHLSKLRDNASKEIKTKDSQLMSALRRSEKLEEDRQILLLEMEDLLSKAGLDNEKLRGDLQLKEKELKYLNSRLDQTKNSQAQIVSETFDLYKDAENNIETLKEKLRSKEQELMLSRSKIDSVQLAHDKVLDENKRVALEAQRSGDTLKTLLDGKSKEINVVHNELMNVKSKEETLTQEKADLEEKIQESERTQKRLNGEMRDKEDELSDTKRELEKVKNYLKSTAAKEKVARGELEEFIEKLLGRAEKAENQIKTLKTKLSEEEEQKKSLQDAEDEASRSLQELVSAQVKSKVSRRNTQSKDKKRFSKRSKESSKHRDKRRTGHYQSDSSYSDDDLNDSSKQSDRSSSQSRKQSPKPIRKSQTSSSSGHSTRDNHRHHNKVSHQSQSPPRQSHFKPIRLHEGSTVPLASREDINDSPKNNFERNGPRVAHTPHSIKVNPTVSRQHNIPPQSAAIPNSHQTASLPNTPVHYNNTHHPQHSSLPNTPLNNRARQGDPLSRFPQSNHNPQHSTHRPLHAEDIPNNSLSLQNAPLSGEANPVMNDNYRHPYMPHPPNDTYISPNTTIGPSTMPHIAKTHPYQHQYTPQNQHQATHGTKPDLHIQSNDLSQILPTSNNTDFLKPQKELNDTIQTLEDLTLRGIITPEEQTAILSSRLHKAILQQQILAGGKTGDEYELKLNYQLSEVDSDVDSADALIEKKSVPNKSKIPADIKKKVLWSAEPSLDLEDLGVLDDEDSPTEYENVEDRELQHEILRLSPSYTSSNSKIQDDLSVDDNGIMWDDAATTTYASEELDSFRFSPSGSETAGDLDSHQLLSSSSGSQKLSKDLPREDTMGRSSTPKLNQSVKNFQEVRDKISRRKSDQEDLNAAIGILKGHHQLDSDSETSSSNDKLKSNSKYSGIKLSPLEESKEFVQSVKEEPMISDQSPVYKSQYLNSLNTNNAKSRFLADKSTGLSPFTQVKTPMSSRSNSPRSVRSPSPNLAEEQQFHGSVLARKYADSNNHLTPEASSGIFSRESSPVGKPPIVSRYEQFYHNPETKSTPASAPSTLQLPPKGDNSAPTIIVQSPVSDGSHRNSPILHTPPAEVQPEPSHVPGTENQNRTNLQPTSNEQQQVQPEKDDQTKEVVVPEEKVISPDLKKYMQVPLTSAKSYLSDVNESDQSTDEDVAKNNSNSTPMKEESTDFDFESDLEKLATPHKLGRSGVIGVKGSSKKSGTLNHKKLKTRRQHADKSRTKDYDSSSAFSDTGGKSGHKKHEEVKRRRVALFRVFNYLDLKTLCAVSLVCKEWKHVSRNPALWRNVQIKNETISSSFLITISQWCTQTEYLILEGGSLAWACLESGLEELLKTCQNSIKSLKIINCSNILTDKCLWLVSGYCRLLKQFYYISDCDPISAETLWALGGGCPGITSLVIPPLFPSTKPKAFTNKCLTLLAKFYPDMLELGIGGKEIDKDGLLPLITGCQRLKYLQLDHMNTMTDSIATSLCGVGLRQLNILELINMAVEPKAITQFYKSCHHLKKIQVDINFTDYYEDIKNKKHRNDYKKKIQLLQDLKKKAGIGHVLKIYAEQVE